VLGADGRAVESEQATAFEDPINDGVGEVLVVQDGAPGLGVLVGGEDHGALADMAIVDDMEQDVGGFAAVGEVAHLVDDEHVRAQVGGEAVAQQTVAAGGRQVIDEGCSGDEGDVEAVLNSAVADGNGEMGFSASPACHAG
jgi:hypothetical protein